MRLVDAPITATTHPDGTPVSFLYRRQTYRVTEIMDSWRYTGRWWEGEGTWVFWRVLASGGEFEVLYDEANDEWRLYRIYD